MKFVQAPTHVTANLSNSKFSSNVSCVFFSIVKPTNEHLHLIHDEGESLKDKAEKEHSAELWNACVESASQALRIASHSVQIRTWRAECTLAAGDREWRWDLTSRSSSGYCINHTPASRMWRSC
ncbi:hypothetical protein BDZ97DRAFT_1837778 [Flammula alnicola]|nr:hypothetical protein BDZ97DRAFT_1837778 [Flammula alnicola]